MRFAVPDEVLEALSRLNEAGHEAYLVGGCVRDDYLGIPPHDYDICTSAYPEEIKAVFADVTTIDTGIKHGTVAVVLKGRPLEITTYRADGPYSDGRRPDYIRYTHKLSEDLKRRDFTMNAMAWHPETGLVDLFGGREDLDWGVIRCVGLARQRFSEDALRILRALRFASAFRFTIEPNAVEAMEEKKETLHKVSVERITEELNKLLLGTGPAEVFRRFPRILLEVLPELAPMYRCPQKSVFHCYDVWEHTLHALAETPEDLSVRWAALLHDSGKPHAVFFDPDGTTHFWGHPAVSTRIAEKLMERLREPSLLGQEVCALVKYHDERIGPDNLQPWLSRLGFPLFEKLMAVQYADMAAHAPHVAEKAEALHDLVDKARAMVDAGACLTLHDLAIDGRTLVENGFDAGPFLGDTLRYLLDRVVNGYAPNDRQALLSMAMERLKEHRARIQLY